MAADALQDKVGVREKIEHELLFGDELPVIGGLGMDDGRAQGSVEGDNTFEVGASEPAGEIHPPVAVAGVESFNGGKKVHGRTREAGLKLSQAKQRRKK